MIPLRRNCVKEPIHFSLWSQFHNSDHFDWFYSHHNFFKSLTIKILQLEWKYSYRIWGSSSLGYSLLYLATACAALISNSVWFGYVLGITSPNLISPGYLDTTFTRSDLFSRFIILLWEAILFNSIPAFFRLNVFVIVIIPYIAVTNEDKMFILSNSNVIVQLQFWVFIRDLIGNMTLNRKPFYDFSVSEKILCNCFNFCRFYKKL